MADDTKPREDARVLEIVLTFESDPPFSAAEVLAIARRCAGFADDVAGEILPEMEGIEVSYGVEVKQVFRLIPTEPIEVEPNG